MKYDVAVIAAIATISLILSGVSIWIGSSIVNDLATDDNDYRDLETYLEKACETGGTLEYYYAPSDGIILGMWHDDPYVITHYFGTGSGFKWVKFESHIEGSTLIIDVFASSSAAKPTTELQVKKTYNYPISVVSEVSYREFGTTYTWHK